MPRIFSEADRETIRRTLIDQGKKAFLRFGIRKTIIDELAAAAGIAKGTFYNFFESKEDLCLAIFDEEEVAMRSEADAILARHDDAAEALRAVMEYALVFVQSDSLLAVLRASGEIAFLARGVGREKLAEHMSTDVAFVGKLLAALREKGGSCPVETEVVAAILRAVVVLTFHEEEIGTQLFAQVMELLKEWISRGIVNGGHES